MARASTTTESKTATDINPAAVYEIAFDRPFQHKLVQYMPGADRVYHVKGSVLAAIKDKVKEYRPVS